MLPTRVPSPLSCDKENIPVTRGEKETTQTRGKALTDGKSPIRTTTVGLGLITCPNAAVTRTNSFREPLLQRGFSNSSLSTMSQSPPHIGVAILTNPARSLSLLALHEEKTYPSTACRSSSLAPLRTHVILGKPARTRSSPLIQDTHLSSPSPPQPRSSPRIIIISDLAREKHCAMPRSEIIQSKQKVSAAPMRAPTAPLISILKAPVPVPQSPALATGIKVEKPAVNAKARNVIVKVLLPKTIVQESAMCEARANTGVHHLGIGTGTNKTFHIAEKIVRGLSSMIRSGSRLAAARRREHPRNRR
jgi:hypothetical protein